MEDKELIETIRSFVGESEGRLSDQISDLRADWKSYRCPDIIKLRQAHVDAEKSNKKLWAIVTVVAAVIGSVSTLMARILIR